MVAVEGGTEDSGTTTGGTDSTGNIIGNQDQANLPGTDKTGEELARERVAQDNTPLDEAVTDDPTGGSHDQVAAKQAANNMGDQDAINTGYQYPEGSNLPTAGNVRRYPELFDQSVIDSSNVPKENEEGGYNESDVIANPPDGEETIVDDTTLTPSPYVDTPGTTEESTNL